MACNDSFISANMLLDRYVYYLKYLKSDPVTLPALHIEKKVQFSLQA